jgi:predicted adenylyl cyclase CyaB
MQEIEVKIIPIDRNEVKAKLKSLGASQTFEGDIETIFFDFPTSSLGNADNLLRLRRKGDKNELTFKRFVANDSAKVREEYEVVVSDFETTRTILRSIGLVEFQRTKKHRVSYALEDGVSIDLDKYADEFAHIPDLMEIEAKDAATVDSHVKLLGFRSADAKNWTTFDLINHYSRISARN